MIADNGEQCKQYVQNMEYNEWCRRTLHDWHNHYFVNNRCKCQKNEIFLNANKYPLVHWISLVWRQFSYRPMHCFLVHSANTHDIRNWQDVTHSQPWHKSNWQDVTHSQPWHVTDKTCHTFTTMALVTDKTSHIHSHDIKVTDKTSHIHKHDIRVIDKTSFIHSHDISNWKDVTHSRCS